MTLRIALAAALLPLLAHAAAAQESCAVCHGKEARQFAGSIHVRGSVTCIDCHGGTAGALEVEAAHAGGLRGLSDARTAVESCGNCHSDVERMRAFGLRTDQLSLYWTSQHGTALAADPAAPVATCTSCHGAHDVLAAADPRAPISHLNQMETCGSCHEDEALMAPYSVATGVVSAYRDSVHGRALYDENSSAAPDCTDCHGSHGAAPPRFADVAQVCGHCHSAVQTFFAESAHAASTDVSVQCITCHSNHAVQKPSAAMFLDDDEGHCGACHEGDRGASVAHQLFDSVQTLAETITAADTAVRDAGGRGLFLGAERGYLDEARGLLVRSRTMTHSLAPEALEDILNRGKGMVGQTMDGLATKNRIFRDRKILTGIFLGISLAFAIVLLMYGAELRARVTKRAGGLGR